LRGYHVSGDEGSNVQVGPAIEIKFVVDKLVGGIGGDSFLGDSEFGNCLGTAITARVRSGSIAVEMADMGMFKMTGEVDHLFRINVLKLISHMFRTTQPQLPCEEP
jgi:hypothetical protein